MTVESTQRNGVATGANNPLPSGVGTLRGSTLGGASLTGSFCNSISMFGVQGGGGGHKKTSRPSLSRIILSLESNSAKQQALQHILNALQVQIILGQLIHREVDKHILHNSLVEFSFDRKTYEENI